MAGEHFTDRTCIAVRSFCVSQAGRPVSCQGFVALARTRALGHHRLETTFFTGSGCGEFYLRLILGSEIAGLSQGSLYYDFIGWRRG